MSTRPSSKDEVLALIKRELPDDQEQQCKNLEAAFEVFEQQTDANVAIAGLVFWARVTLTLPSKAKKVGNDVWGIGSPGAGQSWGTFFYTSDEDLTGCGVSLQVNALTPYMNVNVIKDGRLIGHYHGGSVSVVNGSFGGSGGCWGNA